MPGSSIQHKLEETSCRLYLLLSEASGIGNFAHKTRHIKTMHALNYDTAVYGYSYSGKFLCQDQADFLKVKALRRLDYLAYESITFQVVFKADHFIPFR